MRGFAAVGLDRPKTPENIGGVLRAAFCFDAAMVVIAGDRSKAIKDGIHHGMNTVKAERHIPVVQATELGPHIPFDCIPVAVEIVDDAVPLHAFQHPPRAFYVFGPEDGSIRNDVLAQCRFRVSIPTRICMNLAATVNVVLFDRQAKALRASRKVSQ